MTNEEILNGLHSLRKTEKDTVASILKHLLEIERRNFHLKRGFDSMYTFCQEELGYSKDEASFRIQAMRVLKNVPETEEKLKNGSLSLTSVAKAQAAFRQENCRRKEEKIDPLSQDEKAKTLDLLSSQSSRKAQVELAAIFPQIKKRCGAY